MPKTKSFIVAVAGDTVDGRVIEESWLKDIAANYHRPTYGARVNKEHIPGVTGEAPFKMYGDVLSCSTEPVELMLAGKKVTKLGLRAEIEATDELVAMTANGQKIYTSIEVAPNFANTGKANLVGLAVTDMPASLGTDVLNFAVKHPGAFSTGPQLKHPDNVFSIGYETSFELADGETATPPADSAAGFFVAATAFIKTAMSGKSTEPQQPVSPVLPVEPEVTPPAANDNDPRLSALLSAVEKMAGGIEKLSTEVRGEIGKLRTDQEALRAQIDGTPKQGQFSRQPATGGAASGTHKRAEC